MTVAPPWAIKSTTRYQVVSGARCHAAEAVADGSRTQNVRDRGCIARRCQTGLDIGHASNRTRPVSLERHGTKT